MAGVERPSSDLTRSSGEFGQGEHTSFASQGVYINLARAGTPSRLAMAGTKHSLEDGRCRKADVRFDEKQR